MCCIEHKHEQKSFFGCFPESGADPTIESDSGFNAMDMAVAMGHRNGM